MAIPVLFTASLFPFAELAESVLDQSVVLLNQELRDFFTDKVDLAGSVPDTPTNVVGVDTVINTDNPDDHLVQVTVIAGFKGVSLQEAERLAGQFSSTAFPKVESEVVDPATVREQAVAGVADG